MEKIKHQFINPTFFNDKKNAYLYRALEEINRMRLLFLDNSSDISFIQKEISFTILSSILRKASDLELIDTSHLRKEFNSTIHGVQVFCLIDGSMIIRSDEDIKYNRKGVNFSLDSITRLEKQIEKWIKIKL
jgi:hypothetical protein